MFRTDFPPIKLGMIVVYYQMSSSKIACIRSQKSAKHEYAPFFGSIYSNMFVFHCHPSSEEEIEIFR